MQEKYWFLKNSQFFNRLDDADLSWLESRSRLRCFARNSPIYLPADHADGVLFVVSGRVKICSMTPEGKQSILAFIEPGEMFGELSILAEGSREEYAEATEKSTVVLIPVEYMRELIERHAHLALGVTKLFGLRRKRIERRLKYLLFHSNRDRLIHLLLELAEDYGKQTGAQIDLTIKLSHQDLASIIGSTRETVTVTLGQLQAEGLIKVGRRRISLLNANRLADSVRVSPPIIKKQQPQPPPLGGKQSAFSSLFV